MSESSPLSTRELPAGTLMGHYTLGRKLGEGGMGMVYVAQDTRLGRTVALKVLHANISSDPDRRYRFLREGRLAAGLTHPCIAAVYEVGEADERLFIAMELVEGRSVGALLEESGGAGLRLFQALRITREVVRGLVKAHESGIVHRDLKPENVMYGEDQVVKILDFGVAKRTEEASSEVTLHATKDGSIVGTPAYMSPEQAAGRTVDARSDIFSIGVMLYEMVTGQRPFQGETWQEIIIAIARDPLKPASSLRKDLPPAVDVLLSRCLEKKADARYPNTRALLDDLEQALLGAASGQQVSEAVDALTRVFEKQRSSTFPPMSEGESAPRSVANTEVAVMAEFAAEASSASPNRWRLPLLAVGSAVVASLVAFAVMRSPPEREATPALLPPASTVATGSPTVAVIASTVATGSPTVAAIADSAPSFSPSAQAAARTNVPSSRSSATVPSQVPRAKSEPVNSDTRAVPKTNKTNPVLGF